MLWCLATPTVFALTLAFEPTRFGRAQTGALEGVEIPTTLPDGTSLAINSSEAMRLVNEALRSRFTQQYQGTDLEVQYQSSDEAIQALLNGDVDLAAIGRTLTDTEAQQGLTQLALARPKIAIITSPENPFSGSITVEQFAQIFRGEITNWSEIGGPDAPIVVIDRPAISDTRQAFLNYPVFQNAPFEVASGAISLDADSTEAVIGELGPNSVGYAVADQVLNNPAVKIVPMHDTLPDDPRYPFSQPLSYVYQDTNPSPAALAFLGYATNPENEAVIEAARAGQSVPAATADAPATAETTPDAEAEAGVEDAPAADDPAPAEADAEVSTEAATEAEAAAPEAIIEESDIEVTGRDRGVPWWPWILALPVLGGLLWWLLKDRTPAAAPLAAPDPERRIILTPRNCRDAYAYWELPPSEVDALNRQNCSLALRLHDVTGIEDVDQQPPHSMKQFDCDTIAQGDRHIPIGFDDRDYLVELGYVDSQEQWHALARSESVRVPACASAVPNRAGGIGAAAAAAGVTAAGVAAIVKSRPATSAPAMPAVQPEPARIILTPRDCRQAYAYWELPADQVKALEASHSPLRLRLYDVTELPGTQKANLNSMQEFDCSLSSPGDLHLPIAIDNRDYLVELGYVGANQQWHSLAKSASIRVPACSEAESDRAKTSPDTITTATTDLLNQDRNPKPAAGKLVDSLNNTTARLKDTTQDAVGGLIGKTTETGKAAQRKALGIAGVAAAAGAAAATKASSTVQFRSGEGNRQGNPEVTLGAATRSDVEGESRIILVPRGVDSAYAYWEVAPGHRQELKNQGGMTLALRIHDATNLELDYQPPHSTQEYLCQETDQDRHVKIPIPDRDYVAELGYLTAEGQWLRLLRSLHVRVG